MRNEHEVCVYEDMFEAGFRLPFVCMTLFFKIILGQYTYFHFG